ncbi:SpoIIE family protein phosphatase [Yinghuangia aomiensis]
MSPQPDAGVPEDLPTDLAVVLLDAGGRVLLCSSAARRQLGQPLPPAAAEALRGIPGRGPGARVTVPGVHETLRARSLTTPMYEDTARRADTGPSARLVLLLPADGGGLSDSDDRDRRHRRLAHAAAVDTGASLDLRETAQAFVEVLVPDFADLASVDLAEAVLSGDEPTRLISESDAIARRVAVAAAPGRTWPVALRGVGDPLPRFRESPMLAPVVEGIPVVSTDMARLRVSLGLDDEALDSSFPRTRIPRCWLHSSRAGASSAASPCGAPSPDPRSTNVTRPCSARSRRVPRSAWTTPAATRANTAPPSNCNVRCCRARSTALRPRAPRAATCPRKARVGVGGDWFDVIPLSSLRTAFVVGDVVGHGLMATAAMGRLRTAVQTLADLDLDPDELLSHMDDLVLSYWPEHDPDNPTAELAAQGATAQYAVYDPATGSLTVASAGHPPPLVLRPGHDGEFVDLSPGPPLGVGGMPFESVELSLPQDTLLAFYTDGLVERRGADPGDGMAALARAVDAYHDLPVEEIGPAVLARLAPPRDDDIALLLARTGTLAADAIAEWELPADLAVVSHARQLVTRRLAAWGMDELAYATELVVSELVTNAIRYAGGPVNLRLLRDEILVCEVADPSNTQPRLRRARDTDEGGRGLFLVAQLTARWGSRYRTSGKTIWAEQATAPAPPATTVSEEALLAAFDGW